MSDPLHLADDLWALSQRDQTIIKDAGVMQDAASALRELAHQRYLPLDCPGCGRHRLEYTPSTNELVCEKCRRDAETLNAALREQAAELDKFKELYVGSAEVAQLDASTIDSLRGEVARLREELERKDEENKRLREGYKRANEQESQLWQVKRELEVEVGELRAIAEHAEIYLSMSTPKETALGGPTMTRNELSTMLSSWRTIDAALSPTTTKSMEE